MRTWYTRSRFLFGIVVGVVIGLALPHYERVAEAARTSLDSLQAQINQIISGAQTVGDADALGGVPASAYVSVGDDALLNSVSVAGDVLADHVDANSVQVGFTSATANAATAGTIRWNSSAGRLEVSDGNSWRALQYGPIGP